MNDRSRPSGPCAPRCELGIAPPLPASPGSGVSLSPSPPEARRLLGAPTDIHTDGGANPPGPAGSSPAPRARYEGPSARVPPRSGAPAGPGVTCGAGPEPHPRPRRAPRRPQRSRHPAAPPTCFRPAAPPSQSAGPQRPRGGALPQRLRLSPLGHRRGGPWVSGARGLGGGSGRSLPPPPGALRGVRPAEPAPPTGSGRAGRSELREPVRPKRHRGAGGGVSRRAPRRIVHNHHGRRLRRRW